MRSLTIELPDDLAHRLELAAAASQRTLQQFAVERLCCVSDAWSRTLHAPGSPAAVKQAIEESPQVSGSDVDDLEAAISAGRLPPPDIDLFPNPVAPLIYLLDTTAISDLIRADARMATWVSSLKDEDRLVTCAIVRGEILFGIARNGRGTTAG